MPGDSRPEKFLLDLLKAHKELQLELSNLWQIDFKLEDTIDQALYAGKHNEFHYFSKQLNLNEDQVRMDVIRIIRKAIPDSIRSLESEILTILGC